MIGAGGFGREVLDVIEAMNASSEEAIFRVLGVLDRDPSTLNAVRLAERGHRVIATPTAWLANSSAADFVIGIGNPAVRAALAQEFANAGHRPATLIHPASTVGSRARIAEGVVICAGVQVSSNVIIGSHAHLNPNSIVGHDSELADFVSINPGAIVSGDVRIGEQTLIGAGAVVLQGVSIGGRCTVGASACVTRDVTPGSTVKGIPAR